MVVPHGVKKHCGRKAKGGAFAVGWLIDDEKEKRYR